MVECCVLNPYWGKILNEKEENYEASPFDTVGNNDMGL
jgi:hypothetical protein